MNTPPKPAIPFREWANIFRFAFPVATLIALVWVFRIEWNTMPGATLGNSTDLAETTARLTPKFGAVGVESWVLPVTTLRSTDTLYTFVAEELTAQKRISLTTTDFTGSARLRNSLTPFAYRPPLRLLLGDDPPGARLRGYADWMEQVAEQQELPKRDLIRGFLIFSERLAKTLQNPTAENLHTSLSPLFFGSVWKEIDSNATIRLGNSVGNDSAIVNAQFSKGKLVGPKPEANDLLQRLLWLFPAALIGSLAAFGLAVKRDPAGLLTYLAGSFGIGVWTLAIWEWLLVPLDPLLMIFVPIPFFIGLSVAVTVREMGATPDPNQAFRQVSKKWLYPSLLVVILAVIVVVTVGGAIGRLTIAAAVLIVVILLLHGWCIAEDSLAKKPFPLTQPRKRQPLVLLLLIPVGLVLLLPLQFTRLSITELFDSPIRFWNHEVTNPGNDPVWIGSFPSDPMPVLTALKKELPTLEIYHPQLATAVPLNKEEREWLRPNPINPMLSQDQLSEDDVEAMRMDVMGGWMFAVDRVENVVLSSSDPLIRQSWEIEKRTGSVAKATSELMDPHRGWSPFGGKGDHNSVDLRKSWSYLAIDQIKNGCSNLQYQSREVLSRNTKALGGSWYDAFQLPNGETIAVVFPENEQQLAQLKALLPTTLYLAGPGMLRTVETNALPMVAVALLVLALTISVLQLKQWWLSVCDLIGILLTAALVSFIAVPATLLCFTIPIAWLFGKAFKNRIGLIITGLLLIFVPALLVSVLGGMLLMAGVTRWIGNTE